jgi:hypothetical protein
MAYTNIVDGTSTAPSSSTPGYTLDMRHRTTMSRSSLGVPVLMKVTATATAGDTGAVKLLDSSGAAVLTCLCNEGGTANYAVSGYLPATIAKYDLVAGGNLSGSLTILSVNVLEYDAAAETISGVAAISLGSLTLAATAASQPPEYANAGTSAEGTGSLSPGIPSSTSSGNILLLVVNNGYTSTGAATLSDAQGFAAVTGAAINSGDYSGVRAQTTVFWKRATGSDSAPTVADNGEYNCARIYRFTGCAGSGDPWDVVSSTGDNSGDSSISIGGATTTVSNTLVVAAVTCYTNSGSAAVGSWSNSDLGSVTERDDAVYNAGHEQVIAIATGTKVAAGTYGSTTATWSGGTFWAWSGVTIALKP